MLSPIQHCWVSQSCEYADTANAGAWFVEEIAREAHAPFKVDANITGCIHSFKSTTSLANYWYQPLIWISATIRTRLHELSQIPPASVLVAHDDMLPVGTVKLKFDGGDGGHNGERYYHIIPNNFIACALVPPCRAIAMSMCSKTSKLIAKLMMHWLATSCHSRVVNAKSNASLAY